jgi:ribonuclease R
MNNDEIIGVVSGHRDGHGFVVCEGTQSDIYLPTNEMRAVLHKDRVRVRVARTDRRGRPEGRVTEILERSQDPIIGRLLNEAGIFLVAPEDKRYGQDILVSKNAIGSAQVGQVVVVELTEPPALYGQPVGRVKEVLGEIDDPGMEIEIAVRKYSVPHEFSDECLRLAKGLPDKVRPADKKGRVDLTDVPLVTIDGEDARDFDDAVYCEPAKVGRGKGWRLLVAIADVSHYVQPGNGIDVDAFDRATSVYFPRRVIPMLPEKLSNGLCSLNPEVERLCMVCDMLITATGDIHAYQFYPAVMFSHARFTYTEVATILQNTRSHEALQRGDLVPHLLHLHDAYRGLQQARQRRGAVDFETVETQIISDDTGRIERIIARTRNDAHKVIEEAMLAANVCAAEFIAQSKHLGIFRVHEGPPANKLEILRNYLKAMGVTQTLGDDPKPGDYQVIAKATKDRPEAKQIHTMLLRSMQQAVYTPTNNGHFGLAFEAYTHFTSPIRRYPDLMVHRVIKAVLSEKKYQLPDSLLTMKVPPARKKPAGATPEKPKKALTGQSLAWEMVGLHCSANERRADEASRDVEAWLKCKYMREHLGEEFTGQVSAVTSFGLFVTLDTMYVEGLVHITELGGDFFRFDDIRQELRGERTGIRYALGTVLNIQVSRVDLDGRRIDFRLVKPEGEVGRDDTAERGPRSDRLREARLPKDGAGRAAHGGAKSAKASNLGRSTKPNSTSTLGHSGHTTSPSKAVKGKRASKGSQPAVSKAPSKRSRRS